jgi:hypothetical protein
MVNGNVLRGYAMPAESVPLTDWLSEDKGKPAPNGAPGFRHCSRGFLGVEEAVVYDFAQAGVLRRMLRVEPAIRACSEGGEQRSG